MKPSRAEQEVGEKPDTQDSIGASRSNNSKDITPELLVLCGNIL